LYLFIIHAARHSARRNADFLFFLKKNQSVFAFQIVIKERGFPVLLKKNQSVFAFQIALNENIKKENRKNQPSVLKTEG